MSASNDGPIQTDPAHYHNTAHLLRIGESEVDIEPSLTTGKNQNNVFVIHQDFALHYKVSQLICLAVTAGTTYLLW